MVHFFFWIFYLPGTNMLVLMAILVVSLISRLVSPKAMFLGLFLFFILVICGMGFLPIWWLMLMTLLLFCHVPDPSFIYHGTTQLSSDLYLIFSWCQRWGMKLRPVKTNIIISSRSRTLHPPNPDIIINNQVNKSCNSLKLLWVTLDSNLTFENHIRITSFLISQKIDLLRKCRAIFNDDKNVLNSFFFPFILPFFEYCSPVWMSAAPSHLKLLDRSFNSIKFIPPNFSIHRRVVGALTMLFRIVNNNEHPLHSALPARFQPVRRIRHNSRFNVHAFQQVFCSTNQFSRTFILSLTKVWNLLSDAIVSEVAIDKI